MYSNGCQSLQIKASFWQLENGTILTEMQYN